VAVSAAVVSRRAAALSFSGCGFGCSGRAFAFASARRAFLVAAAFRRRGWFVGVRAVPSAPGLLLVVAAPSPLGSPAGWPFPSAGGAGVWLLPVA
jgi:hypothetical protein